MATETNKVSYGGDLMIFVATGATKLPIAFSTSAKLDITLNTREISSKDSGYWTDKAAGKFDWNMSTDALYSYVLTTGSTNNTIDELYDMMLTREVVNVAFAKKTGTAPNWTEDSSNKVYSGTALITSISLTAGNDDNASYTVTLEGVGTLTKA